ncbi:MAG: hypothetical protein WCG10_00585 [Chlamydiota bacterium]
MRLFIVGSFIALCGMLHAECKDPLLGKRHLIIDAEYTYLKRAPKIHNKGCIIKVADELPAGVAAQDSGPGCTPGKCRLRTVDLLSDQKSTSGIRLTADYLTDRYTTWQLRYLGMLSWHGSADAYCDKGLEFPFKDNINNTIDFQNANRMKGVCDTDFWSGEANYWYHVTPQRVDAFSVSWLFGLRYLSLKEHFNLLGQRSYSSSNYKIETKNRMVGPQLGGDFEANFGPNFTWGISAKMGPIIDFAQNCSRMRDNNNTKTISSYNPSDFNVCFLGELAPFFLFNLFKNIIFKMSYEILYLSNVALAMNQITYHEQNISELRNHVNIGGYFMCYGLFIGLGVDF